MVVITFRGISEHVVELKSNCVPVYLTVCFYSDFVGFISQHVQYIFASSSFSSSPAILRIRGYGGVVPGCRQMLLHISGS